MRREELFSAVSGLLNAVDESGVLKLFEVRPTKSEQRHEKQPNLDALEVFRRFEAFASSFTATERQLLKIFELSQIESSAFWLEAITAGADSPKIRRLATRLYHFQDFAPQVLAMLETEAIREKRAEASSGKSTRGEVLTAILIEETGQASKPDRVVDAIESISQLYAVFARLRNVPPESLAIIGCDSGSDKSFDFLGAASAIAALKELILELWDRAIFYRQTRTEQNLSVALKSLSVVAEISKLEENGALEHEDAERLRHSAVTAASTFLECGVLIPEIEKHTTFNPRALMAPQPKLLTGSLQQADSEGRADESTGGPTPTSSSLTSEEERLLRRLLDRARGESTDTDSEL